MKFLPSYLAEVNKEGGNPLFGFYVSTDEKNVTQYVAGLWQGGLSLPDKGYYLKNEPREKNIREKYVEHVANMFVLKGETPEGAKAKANVVMGIETKLAKASMDRTAMRDPYLTYNKFSIADFDKQSTNFKLGDFLKTVGVAAQDSILVGQPGFFKAMDNMLGSVSLEDWKTYLTWHQLTGAASFVSSKFDNENFDIEIKKIPGQRSGISLKYFFMLAGNENMVKTDRMIIRFLSNTLERKVKVAECLPLLLDLTTELNEIGYRHLNPRLLDNKIWLFQRSILSKPKTGNDFCSI